MKYLLIGTLICLVQHAILGQIGYWSLAQESFTTAEKSILNNAQQEVFALDDAVFRSVLTKVDHANEVDFDTYFQTIWLPLPNGSIESFQIISAPIMAKELAKKFPTLKTYKIQHSTKRQVVGRLDFSPKGLRGIIHAPEGSILIDPISLNQRIFYQSLYTDEYIPRSWEETVTYCGNTEIGEQELINISSLKNEAVQLKSGSELRTYRLAVAASGEYTQYHGGTVTDGMGAIVTTINRLNSIFEIEVAVRFELIANNDIIVYTDSNTDPFTASNAGLTTQNSNLLRDVIGYENYDIGHLFNRSGGGQAGVAGVCQDVKKGGARSGRVAPLSSVNLLSTVSHEFGHQLGARHSFNGSSGSCTNAGGGPAAYEPGSGSTIMSYAGACGSQSLQSSKDYYFNNSSFNEIIQYISLEEGNSCPAITSTGNAIPEVFIENENYHIPKSTPFILTGTATDADGDDLIYSWEERDLGPQGAPNMPEGNAPIFRSFPATEKPERIFPRIESIIANTQVLGEILPTYARKLNFRLTVRDNNPASGGVASEEIKLHVVGEAGPFLVQYPNENIDLDGGENVMINWDVANTDQAPIFCDKVDILLSLDGGYSFSELLAHDVLNDGSQVVLIPNIPSEQARIKIACSSNIFFDISNENFTIKHTDAGFTIDSEPLFSNTCQGDSIKLDIEIGQIGDFQELVQLSASPISGILSFNPEQGIPPFTSTLTIVPSNSDSLLLSIVASSELIDKETSMDIFIKENSPFAPQLNSPPNQARDLPFIPEFSWEEIPDAESYLIQFSTDADFNDIILETSVLTNRYSENEFDFFTEYFWRVSGVNICGEGIASEIFSFKTTDILCTNIVLENLFIPMGQFVSPAISAIEIINDGRVRSVEVSDLMLVHDSIGALEIHLLSPSGTDLLLFDNSCEGRGFMDINFSDAGIGPAPAWPCPPDDLQTYQPLNSFDLFNGESLLGDWTLIVDDGMIPITGFNFLRSWGLNICYQPVCDVNISIAKEDISCFGTGDGWINITSDIPIDSVVWDHGVTGSNLESLAAGIYSGVVYVEGDCQEIFNIELKRPEAIDIQSELLHPNCFGDSTGQIALEVTGGTGSLNILWENDWDGNVLEDLVEGNYSVTISDENLCNETQTFSIMSPEAITDDASLITNASCFEAGDGEICVEIEGGIPPYDYQWQNIGFQAAKLSNLGAGEYLLTVVDSVGCSYEQSFEVNQPSPLEISLEDLSISNMNNGSITINVAGGTGSYDIVWYESGVEVGSGENINGLSEGIYSAIIMDENGCVLISPNYNLILTSVSEIEEFKIQVYPNPAQNHFKISLVSGVVENYEYDLIGVNGVSIWEDCQIEQLNASELRVWIPNGISGIYYVTLIDQQTSSKVETSIPVILRSD